MTEQQTISPERQIAATQIGAVFNSLHDYLNMLQGTNEDGTPQFTQQLVNAHIRVDEAAMWAIKHALMYGVPKRATPPAPAAPDAPTTAAPAVPDAPTTAAPTPDDVPLGRRD